MEIVKDGRRYYLQGLAFAHKDTAKDAGCKWDADKKAWWTGKAEVAESVLVKAQEEPKAEDPLVSSSVEYKGRTYYAVKGASSSTRQRLVSLDGKLSFWADRTLIQPKNTYSEPKRLSSLRRFVERQKDGGDSL